MNFNVSKSRMNQVIMVDSINSSEADFLATHIPFKNLAFRYGINNSILEKIDEEASYIKLFTDPSVKDKHQLVIVEGSSGSGKSHFIRWLYAKLNADSFDNDEILLIRRNDNTLKGTIKQLLSIAAVKNLKNKDIYERLVKANNTISDKKFKDEIYYKFIIEVENSDDEILTSGEKKRLAALLSDSSFKQKLLSFDGPIERIFSKISASAYNNTDIIAQFNSSDFIIDTDMFEELSDYASRDAKGIAKYLINDEDELDKDLLKRITDFMNKHVETVIQSCAGIEPGDFQQIFKEIRQELKKVEKNLILLIEDITSFTGINQALLNALVVEHTGLNQSDEMCRLISVIGTTSEYYRQFRDNYRDRITSQITISDGIIGQNDNDLYLFFAKYLNAISISEEQVNDWYINNGADPKLLPIGNGNDNWEIIDYLGKKISLYPFTKKSILSLYNSMDEHKTPRYILREIIEPIISELVDDKGFVFYHLQNKNIPLSDNQISRIDRLITELNLENDFDHYKKRAECFIGFYGNGKFEKIGNKIIGIEKKLYDEFGFSDLYNKLDETVSIGVDDNVDPIILKTESNQIIKKEENNEYNSFKKMLNNWYEKNDLFISRYVLESLNSIIISSINWQQYNVSNQIINMIKTQTKFNLLTIENQQKNDDSSVYKLPVNKDTYDLLRAIGQWRFVGKSSWKFDGADDAIFIITSWIEKNKMIIIDNIKKYFDSTTPLYINESILYEIYRRILNCDLDINELNMISVNVLAVPYKKNNNFSCNNSKWHDLSNAENDDDSNDIYNIILSYFNITMGSGNTKFFINYMEFEKNLNSLKKDDFVIDLSKFKGNFSLETKINDKLIKLENRLNTVLQAQKDISCDLLSKIYLYFGFDNFDFNIDLDDFKDLMGNIKEFYKGCEQNNYFISTPSQIEDVNKCSSKICKQIRFLKEVPDKIDINLLFKYSKINYKLLYDFISLLDIVNSNLNIIMQQNTIELEKLTRSGKIIDIDPRFDDEKTNYMELKNEMEEYFND